MCVVYSWAISQVLVQSTRTFAARWLERLLRGSVFTLHMHGGLFLHCLVEYFSGWQATKFSKDWSTFAKEMKKNVRGPFFRNMLHVYVYIEHTMQ